MNREESIFIQARGEDQKYNISSAGFLAATEEAFLYVEGDPDKAVILMLFGEYISHHQIHYGTTKEGVKKCVMNSVEKHSGDKTLYRGLVDCDIEPYRKSNVPYKYNDCLIYTDTRDLETLLWSTGKEMFRKLLLQMPDKTAQGIKYQLEARKDEMFEKITEAAYQLGIVRLIVEDSQYSRKGIKVNEEVDPKTRKPISKDAPPYCYYSARDCTMDIIGFLNESLCASDRYRMDLIDIQDQYEEEVKRRRKEKWNIIRGHDLNYMMMKTLNQWRPSYNQWQNVGEFEEYMRVSYEKHWIEGTQLAREIVKWATSLVQKTA